MTILVLVQHGDKERIPGDPRLTQRGCMQAHQAALALAALGRATAIYASPLKRAAETASIIADHLGLAVHHDARLRERINWEGGPFETFLSEWEHTTADRSYQPASGDSSYRAADRMVAAISEIAGTHPDEMALVVTHGGVTVDLLRTLLGDDALAAAVPQLLTDGIPSCALTTVKRVNSKWLVDRIARPVHPAP